MTTDKAPTLVEALKLAPAPLTEDECREILAEQFERYGFRSLPLELRSDPCDPGEFSTAGKAALAAMQEAAKRAVERVRCAPSQWLPIETAPKDGTPFLGVDNQDYGSVYRVWWQPEFKAWIEGCSEMRLAEGYRFTDGSMRRLHSPLIRTPTHWMPLPAPPKEGE